MSQLTEIELHRLVAYFDEFEDCPTDEEIDYVFEFTTKTEWEHFYGMIETLTYRHMRHVIADLLTRKNLSALKKYASMLKLLTEHESDQWRRPHEFYYLYDEDLPQFVKLFFDKLLRGDYDVP